MSPCVNRSGYIASFGTAKTHRRTFTVRQSSISNCSSCCWKVCVKDLSGRHELATSNQMLLYSTGGRKPRGKIFWRNFITGMRVRRISSEPEWYLARLCKQLGISTTNNHTFRLAFNTRTFYLSFSSAERALILACSPDERNALLCVR